IVGQETEPATILSSQFESRQGRHGKPDVIAHKYVPKGASLRCVLSERYPDHPDEPAGCVVTFKSGEKVTLPPGERTKAPEDGEVYLECLGHKPTRCVVRVW